MLILGERMSREGFPLFLGASREFKNGKVMAYFGSKDITDNERTKIKQKLI